MKSILKKIITYSFCLFLLTACLDGFKSTDIKMPSIDSGVNDGDEDGGGDDFVVDYYIRVDGGNKEQCNGRVDAAYSGSGTNQNCAWKHPFYAFSVNGSSMQAVPGGSVILIKSGSYEMGIGGIPSQASNCHNGGSCHMKPVPSGTAEKPTRILGEGFANGCSNKPELWGSGGVSRVLNLVGSNYIELECLEISDRSNCITAHRHAEAGTSPYRCQNGDNYATNGIVASDSSNVTLKNIDIHGLAVNGVHAGRLTDWHMEKVKINANGWAGWSGNIGAGVSSNSGTLYFKEVEIAWNGCTKDYPNNNIVGCWAQISGGYGDGLGTHATGGKWIFEDSRILHNTSDGIDLLYANNDIEVVIRRVLVEGNAGNQIKVNGKTTIEDSIVIGNCGYFARNSTGLSGNENCRAFGDAISIGLKNDRPVILKNNTIFSEGNVLLSSGCGSGCDHIRTDFRMYNNIFVGYSNFINGQLSALHWHMSPFGDGAALGINTASKNIVYNVKNNFCPVGDNLCNTNPGLVSIANIDQVDPHLLSTSPARNAADPNFASPTDFYNVLRDIPDIGAIEY